MRKPKIDPVLSALIAKLPASGAAWPADQRSAWFEMMWLSCNVVYGGAGEAPPYFKPKVVAAAGKALDAAGLLDAYSRVTGKALAREKPMPAFFIDAQGIAQNAKGDRINPNDVGGNVIVDMRGEHGDLGTIQWADGSTGTRGLQLEITTSVS